MRDTLGAPLVHEGDPARIWRCVSRDASTFQLPGVWLSADELYALMLAQHRVGRIPRAEGKGPAANQPRGIRRPCRDTRTSAVP